MAITKLETNGVIRSFVADGAITAGAAVEDAGSGKVKAPAAGNQVCVGIALETVADGETVSVCIQGVATAIANEALTAVMTPLTNVITTGYLEAADADKEPIVAYNLELATAQGDEIRVLVDHGYYAA